MKKIKTLIIVISIVLFLAVLLLGANTVFSVAKVDVSYALSTSQAEADAKAVQAKLDEEYLGKNILFVKESEVLSHFSAYPYFSVTKVEKVYPNKLALTVEEKTESYAFVSEEGGKTYYYMADVDGTILRKTEENKNNADGGDNFYIEGLTFANGKVVENEFFTTAMAVCQKLEDVTGNTRTSLQGMTFDVNVVQTVLTIKTREGVEIQIENPAQRTDEKISAGMECYLALGDSDKLYGYFSVLENKAGEILATYVPRS